MILIPPFELCWVKVYKIYPVSLALLFNIYADNIQQINENVKGLLITTQYLTYNEQKMVDNLLRTP